MTHALSAGGNRGSTPSLARYLLEEIHEMFEPIDTDVDRDFSGWGLQPVSPSLIARCFCASTGVPTARVRLLVKQKPRGQA